MDELVKAIKQFLIRDITFITGGSFVVLSFSYNFNLALEPFSLFKSALIMSVGYIIGYSAQDIFSMTGLCSTKCGVYNPGMIIKFLYRKFTGTKWTQIEDYDSHTIGAIIGNTQRESIIGEVQRVIFFNQLGATVGSCGLICAIFFLLALVKEPVAINIALLVSTILISTILLILSKVKLAQEKHSLIKAMRIIDPAFQLTPYLIPPSSNEAPGPADRPDEPPDDSGDAATAG